MTMWARFGGAVGIAATSFLLGTQLHKADHGNLNVLRTGEAATAQVQQAPPLVSDLKHLTLLTLFWVRLRLLYGISKLVEVSTTFLTYICECLSKAVFTMKE